MKSLITILCATFLGSSVQAAVLTFDGATCDGGAACGNGSTIDQGYGSFTGVTVVYDANVDLAGLQPFYYWGENYSGLTSVAYGNIGQSSTLTFVADPGYEVTLGGLQLGGYSNTDRSLSFTVTDLSNNGVVYDSVTATGTDLVLGITPSSFEFNLSSLVGLKISFSGDFYNGGVDNVIYDATEVSPVPLPASALLLGGGLAGLAGLLRRCSRNA